MRTGRCVKVFEMEGPVKLVKWNPKKSIVIAAVLVDHASHTPGIMFVIISLLTPVRR